jgi:Alpha/beta hydrolase domain
MKRMLPLAGVLTLGLISADGKAGITGIEITSRQSFAEGTAFGTAGAYERITGIAHGEVDPADARNAPIVDLDKAPRNAHGRVEYDTDIFILRPVDATRGNGALLYEVNNRGMKTLAGTIMGATPHGANPLAAFNDPHTAEDMGDALLLKLGYTLVWSGWDPNAPRSGHGMAMNAPIALEGGKPIERATRDEFYIGPSPMPVPNPVFHLSYESASLDARDATLTVRWQEAGKGTHVPAGDWRFVDSRSVALLPEGSRPLAGALYELHYRARAPQVMGLGFAATRDLISYLRRAPDSPTPGITRTLAMGISQSGRYLRAFLALGFNRDESNARVFDGMFMHIAGAGKVFLNDTFSQPSRTNAPYSDHFFPDFGFPYSMARQKDPSGGVEAGILRGDDTDPLCVEINTSTEFWQKAASLIATDPAGSADVPLPDRDRAYFLAGLPHAPLAFAQGDVLHPVNMLSPTFALRALLLRLDAWVARGEPPPASVWPQLARHTLVRRNDLKFPAIPQTRAPAMPNAAQRIADWVEPRAASGAQPQVLVPQVDADGQDLGGVRLPEVDVPLGTSLGWNLLKGDQRAGQMATLIGSFVPFAPTKAARDASHDPRLSLEERYQDRDDYAARFRRSIDALVARGFIRAEDADRYAQTALDTKAFTPASAR